MSFPENFVWGAATAAYQVELIIKTLIKRDSRKKLSFLYCIRFILTQELLQKTQDPLHCH